MVFERSRVSLISLLAASAFLLASAEQACAFSIFGITLFEDESEAAAHAVIADPRDYSVDISVTGNGALKDQLSAASALWAGREEPASGAAGLLATARSDYRRIQSALYAAGFYGGTISIRVDGKEAADLAPDATLSDPISVAVSVDSGPVFRFDRAEIVNPAPTPASEADQVSGPDGFSTGAIARAGAVRQAALVAVKAWNQLGYPKASVTNREVVADHATNRLDAVLTVTPGPHAVLGAISVDGETDMIESFIIRQTGLVPGAEYDPDDLKRARERLADLDVFSSIRITEADAVGPDGTLPLTIVVQERKPRRIGAGASFSTTDGLGLETYFLHRNLFGGGERLKLTAKLAGIAYPVDSADFDYYFGGTLTKPGIFTPDTDLVADLTAQRTVLPNYTETSVNGKIGLTHQFSNQISVAGGVEAEQAGFIDDLYGNRSFTLVGAYGGVTYDTRNDATDPSEGIYASVTASPFYDFQFGNAGIQLTTEARGYAGFGDNDQFVLAGRVKAGFLYGPSLAETPPDKLFFAGGGGSVRGYSYRSIGVDGPGDTVTGGQFLTEASVEARVKVSDTLGFVAFADAGYVTADSFVGLADGTRIGVGTGLRYYTDFGPLRLDVAVPLNKRDGDPNFALYAGIGQAF